jgi:serine/threonine-protein kinase RsbW
MVFILVKKMQSIDYFELQIRNDLIELRSMSEWLSQACKKLAMTDDLARDLDACANEAVANIILYAYEDLESHPINMRLELKDTSLIFTIQDDGIAFDPFNSKATLSQSYDTIGEITIGGFGIKLIRSLANECNYYRSDNKNIMSLGFYLYQASATSILGENSPFFLNSCHY